MPRACPTTATACHTNPSPQLTAPPVNNAGTLAAAAAPRGGAEALNLLETAGPALLKRLLGRAAAAIAVVALLGLLRRRLARRRNGTASMPRVDGA
jgi:hypothetical protein